MGFILFAPLLPVEGSQFAVLELKSAASLLHMQWLAGVHLNCVEHAMGFKKSKYYLLVMLVIWGENTTKLTHRDPGLNKYVSLCYSVGSSASQPYLGRAIKIQGEGHIDLMAIAPDKKIPNENIISRPGHIDGN